MNIIAGIAGADRNAAAALSVGGRVVAMCEQERMTRTRRAGLRPGRLPAEAMDAVLGIAGRAPSDVAAYAVAEPAIVLPTTLRVERLDHHFAHAATAFFTSPFDDAAVLVCDRHGNPELTVWRGDSSNLTRADFGWIGPAFATAFAETAHAFGFAPGGDEHKIEALARVGFQDAVAPPLAIGYYGDRLDVGCDFHSSVARALGAGGASNVGRAARLAAGMQRRLGELLLEVVGDVKARVGGRHLCLGGGLFFNSYLTTLVAEAGLYERTFVPVNVGNAGVAVGAALGVAGRNGPLDRAVPLSPFLGPEFGPAEIKATLDNCKLSYDYLSNGQMIDRTVSLLSQGKLVAWFQGRMEWGARALGNRSILASPSSPFVLENLNVFLKHREPHQSYGVSICAEDAPRYFDGPASSDFMEHEFEVLDPDALRAVLPLDSRRLRVQTVPRSAGLFHTLLRACGEATGLPMVVNTSFNGFNEPIVCTPRDAVRVFYGTGLDMAVIGDGFVLHK